jgi:hypothetical protein
MPDFSAIFSSENVIVALIGLTSGAVGGAIGSIIAPLVNWRIEQQKQTRTDHKEKIQKWRQMVHEITLKLQAIQRGEFPAIPNVRSQAGFLIEMHPDFLSLQPLLQGPARGRAFGSMTFHAGRTTPDELICLAAEIDKIEEKWGLR